MWWFFYLICTYNIKDFADILKLGTIPQLKKSTWNYKRYLEIDNRASNVACRSEFGRFSLIINIYKNILYYVL